jgi:hypothetical protein
VVRVARGGGTGGLLYAAQRDQGDVGVMGKIPAVLHCELRKTVLAIGYGKPRVHTLL